MVSLRDFGLFALDLNFTDMDSVKKSPKFNRGNFYESYRLGSLLGSGAFADVRVVVKIDKQASKQEDPDHLLMQRRSLSMDRTPLSCDSRKDSPRGNIFAAKLIYKERADLNVLARELQLLCDLPFHPNITSLYEWFEAGELIVLIMDLAVGGDVFDRLDEVETFSEKDAAKIIHTVLNALHFCHQNNVVHRDIKPENILYATKNFKTSEIQITDFGLGIKGDGGGKGANIKTICGTPSYIAPEILSGKGYGSKVDVYAAGVLCFELLTGRSPFEEYEDDLVQMYNKILTTGVNIDEDADPVFTKISQSAKSFILKLCSSDPNERPDAGEALQDLWFLSLHDGSQSLFSTHCLKDDIKSRQDLKKDKPLKKAAGKVLQMIRATRTFGSSKDKLEESASVSSTGSAKKIAFSKSATFSGSAEKTMSKKENIPTVDIKVNRSFDDNTLRRSIQFEPESRSTLVIEEEEEEEDQVEACKRVKQPEALQKKVMGNRESSLEQITLARSCGGPNIATRTGVTKSILQNGIAKPSTTSATNTFAKPKTNSSTKLTSNNSHTSTSSLAPTNAIRRENSEPIAVKKKVFPRSWIGSSIQNNDGKETNPCFQQTEHICSKKRTPLKS